MLRRDFARLEKPLEGLAVYVSPRKDEKDKSSKCLRVHCLEQLLITSGKHGFVTSTQSKVWDKRSDLQCCVKPGGHFSGRVL